MKDRTFISNQVKLITARHAAQGCLAALLVALMGIGGSLALCQAQPSGEDVPGAEVLTRGPVHEAFAGMVTFNPEPGVVITKAPPEVIEELPPEERPEGDNVTWIPGYWGWDDERSDFLWVSGTWRALPPGRAWIAGYWGQTSQGHQWISGYWADASVRETTYLPPPPATVEVGPNIAAPSSDYGWSPGCWVWYQGRYAWQPGYWAQGRADWDWMPAHYVWTPRGCIFVGGYWDYPVQRRGIVFAPVYFESSYYSRRGYVYSPSIVISLGVFTDHLFLRPSYSHYYFGDYYAPSYYQGGFYASFSFQSSHHGYDPFYSRQRWTHRQDRDWERRTETSYQYRRDHETARPPRTWAAQRNISLSTAESDQNRMLVAAPINQIAKRKDSSMRFQPVAKEERQQLAQRGKEVQKSREQRRTLETTRVAEPTARTSGRAFEPAAQAPGRTIEPTKVQLPRSPIVAKSANQLERNQAPPRPQQAPKPNLKVQPKAEPASRQPAVERSNSRPQPRRPETEQRPPPGRSEAKPAAREQPVQAQPQPRAKESGAKAQAEAERNASGLEKKASPQSEPRAKDPAVNAREESQRNTRALEQRTRQDSEQRAKDAALKSQENSQRNARGLEKQAPPATEQRAKDPVVKARETPQRNANAVAKQAPRASERPARQNPASDEKGATKLLKKDPKAKGKP